MSYLIQLISVPAKYRKIRRYRTFFYRRLCSPDHLERRTFVPWYLLLWINRIRILLILLFSTFKIFPSKLQSLESDGTFNSPTNGRAGIGGLWPKAWFGGRVSLNINVSHDNQRERKYGGVFNSLAYSNQGFECHTLLLIQKQKMAPNMVSVHGGNGIRWIK